MTRMIASLVPVLGSFITWIVVLTAPAHAETLIDALAAAFEKNPTLNAQRANVEAVGENLPRTRAGYLPKIGAVGESGYTYEAFKPGLSSSGSLSSSNSGPQLQKSDRQPQSYGLQVTQPLFDGFRTSSAHGQAASQVQGARETLRGIEQSTLLEAVRAYVNVLANRAILARSRDNVGALEKQLAQIRARRGFGDATRTDVVQIEARVAVAASQVSLAEDDVKASQATYERITGRAPPAHLEPAYAADALVPRTLDEALQVAMDQHPAILAAISGADAAKLQINIVEGELLPTISLAGSTTQRYDLSSRGDQDFDATLRAQVQVPIFEGGEVRARARQAGHVLAQRQLEADAIRDQVRASVATAWSQLQTSKNRLGSSAIQFSAARTALAGIREEYRMGERTTYDLLTSEQDYLTAEVAQVTAHRDRVLATYALAQAAGILSFAAMEELASKPPGGVFVSEARSSHGQLDVTLDANSDAKAKPAGPCKGCRKPVAVKPKPEIIETRAEPPKGDNLELARLHGMPQHTCKDCANIAGPPMLRPSIVAAPARSISNSQPATALKASFTAGPDPRPGLQD